MLLVPAIQMQQRLKLLYVFFAENPKHCKIVTG